jgi:hypothetical protein
LPACSTRGCHLFELGRGEPNYQPKVPPNKRLQNSQEGSFLNSNVNSSPFSKLVS